MYIIISYNCRYRNLVPINNYNIWTYLFRNAQSELEDKVADMERDGEKEKGSSLCFDSIQFYLLQYIVQMAVNHDQAIIHLWSVFFWMHAINCQRVQTIFLCSATESSPALVPYSFFFARNYWLLVTHVNLINVPSTFFRTKYDCACNVVIFNTVCHECTVKSRQEKHTVSHSNGFVMSPPMGSCIAQLTMNKCSFHYRWSIQFF